MTLVVSYSGKSNRSVIASVGCFLHEIPPLHCLHFYLCVVVHKCLIDDAHARMRCTSILCIYFSYVDVSDTESIKIVPNLDSATEENNLPGCTGGFP